VRHPTLGNITLPNRKRRTDVPERLILGVRPLRYDHRHDHRKVFFLPLGNVLNVLSSIKLP
jgi:hypothetical protein